MVKTINTHELYKAFRSLLHLENPQILKNDIEVTKESLKNIKTMAIIARKNLEKTILNE